MRRTLWLLGIFLSSPLWAGSAPLTVSLPSDVLYLSAGQPLVFTVHGPADGAMQARILDSQGFDVVELRRSGERRLMWDGRDAKGRSVKAGVYLLEVVEEPYLWNGAISVAP